MGEYSKDELKNERENEAKERFMETLSTSPLSPDLTDSFRKMIKAGYDFS